MSVAMIPSQAPQARRAGSRGEFKYACTIAMPKGEGERASGEILVNAHYDFVIRRIAWHFYQRDNIAPRVRVTWRDTRRNYVDRPALIEALFGRAGEDYPMVAPITIERGSTLTFEAIALQDNAVDIDIVLHGLELEPVSP